VKAGAAVILAAGLGKRMKSKTAKVLHPLAGRPMLTYAVERALALSAAKTVVVAGHQSERIKEVLSPYRVEIVHQPLQRGTADAVLQAKAVLESVRGPVLILNADTPLITDQTLGALLAAHGREKAAVTLLTALVSNPDGYGRIVRDARGRVKRVVEQKDASDAQLRVKEINTGFYVADPGFLFNALRTVRNSNRQGEFYLTDIIEAAVRGRRKLAVVRLARDPEEITGINTRADLARAEGILRRRIRRNLMEDGVTLLDPDTAWIDAGVAIGRDTVVHPNVRIEGESRIGEDCVIRSHSRLADCRVGSGVEIRDACVLEGSVLEDGVTVGPFAHLRAGTVVRKGARIGNFVETKKTEVGEGSKANHLAYLGDAVIGKGVNIGAGTITCNYDGYEKFQTVIEDGVFVGSDTQLVAPVRVGRGAVVAAGSTVCRDVPEDALAMSRVPQENKPGWARRRREARQTRGKGKRKG
jgi:bifunctional UDP-N-acetylglucosamine pyrophosphorylase/glucosamine-1-phosphate N-acetyltransferase